MSKKFALALVLLNAAAAFAAVDVNDAPLADLESVKGIGPTLATRILDERKSGAFKDWPDLARRVRGVSAAKLSQAGLTVNGAGLEAARPAASQPPAPR